MVLDLADRVAGTDVDEVPGLAVSPYTQVEHDHARCVTNYFRDTHPRLSLLVLRVRGIEAFRPRLEHVQKVFAVKIGGREGRWVPLEFLVERQLRHG